MGEKYFIKLKGLRINYSSPPLKYGPILRKMIENKITIEINCCTDKKVNKEMILDSLKNLIEHKMKGSVNEIEIENDFERVE